MQPLLGFYLPSIAEPVHMAFRKSKSLIFTVQTVVFLSSVFLKCQNHLVKMLSWKDCDTNLLVLSED